MLAERIKVIILHYHGQTSNIRRLTQLPHLSHQMGADTLMKGEAKTKIAGKQEGSIH